MYHDIAEDIIQQINNHVYTDKLPSEAKLTDHYSVSRNTVRKAIDEVCQQGLLRRIKGSGYFVNQITIDDEVPVVNLSLGAGKAMKAINANLTSKVLIFEVTTADQFQAEHLHIEIGEPLTHILRLRKLDGTNYCLEDSYYLKSQIPQITVKDAEKSIFSAIKRDYNLTVNSAENYVKVANLTEQELALTGITTTETLLALTQINYHGNNIAFVISTTKFFDRNFNLYFHSSQTFGGETK
ncbi:transcription regulator [Paucilactobacillus oligofermentans DSM 15707 = LMG 22743]|uniref:Transcription regulator n=1 Tax=Paucilactobacillus oligofermentans DSM 15707 = LMG 22743 TaxID=1423778 RepID=A0A0R1RQU1_9LACO|nr:GntR family transcriptional regulator [Paucilactobacillus oligofermentans]KRL55723.1 transcription regulator [Paucilactobacillus oligofermentans DSM 15707 = LMG 22743]CUS27057.1 HTH-type transcriptional regulator GmuR [Paucilactobacillus oligofermentans DSM 15707 = LMG 22743]